MISEPDYSGPPPEWEPACRTHPWCRIVDGRCPECDWDRESDDFRHEPHYDPGPAQVGSDTPK
jgi:hypothetical protein